jgi:hypothetical protein
MWKPKAAYSGTGFNPAMEELGTMRNTVLLVVLVSALCWAAPNPDEYADNVHVSGSRLFSEAAASGLRQRLIVVINAKKYELLSISGEGKLLALGDYMAKTYPG